LRDKEGTIKRLREDKSEIEIDKKRDIEKNRQRKTEKEVEIKKA